MAKKNVNPLDLGIPVCSVCGRRLRGRRRLICPECEEAIARQLSK